MKNDHSTLNKLIVFYIAFSLAFLYSCCNSLKSCSSSENLTDYKYQVSLEIRAVNDSRMKEFAEYLAGAYTNYLKTEYISVFEQIGNDFKVDYCTTNIIETTTFVTVQMRIAKLDDMLGFKAEDSNQFDTILLEMILINQKHIEKGSDIKFNVRQTWGHEKEPEKYKFPTWLIATIVVACVVIFALFIFILRDLFDCSLEDSKPAIAKPSTKPAEPNPLQQSQNVYVQRPQFGQTSSQVVLDVKNLPKRESELSQVNSIKSKRSNAGDRIRRNENKVVDEGYDRVMKTEFDNSTDTIIDPEGNKDPKPDNEVKQQRTQRKDPKLILGENYENVLKNEFETTINEDESNKRNVNLTPSTITKYKTPDSSIGAKATRVRRKEQKMLPEDYERIMKADLENSQTNLQDSQKVSKNPLAKSYSHEAEVQLRRIKRKDNKDVNNDEYNNVYNNNEFDSVILEAKV